MCKISAVEDGVCGVNLLGGFDRKGCKVLLSKIEGLGKKTYGMRSIDIRKGNTEWKGINSNLLELAC